MTLSIVMITKNEANCLAACLHSVQPIANEIVVGDTGSSDATAAIAEQFGARVMPILWENDFASARNQVLEAATGDWLLHMDADEVLDEAGATKIRALVDADGDGADAIEITLANYCDSARAWRWMAVEPGDPMARGHAGYIAAPLLRLFRNRHGYHYREPVHENITDSVREAGGVIRSEPILVHHYGYACDEQTATRKSRMYLEINRRKTEKYQNDPKAWSDYAEQAFACGDAASAEQAARNALRLEPYHVGAATMLANILMNRGDLDEAHDVLASQTSEDSAPPHILTALAAIACKQGRLDEALAMGGAVIEVNPKAVFARQVLARAYDRLGEGDRAEEQWRIASETVPSLDEFRKGLEGHRLRRRAEDVFRNGDPTQALALLTQALALDPDDPITYNDVGVVSEALGRPTEARTAFERALALAPGLVDAEHNLAALG
jgi:Flp pilus assembly protein TadD